MFESGCDKEQPERDVKEGGSAGPAEADDNWRGSHQLGSYWMRAVGMGREREYRVSLQNV